ncbi:MAG TPA: N-acetylmuramoyl-L-alanine amidase-like domain-containing protein [Coxiellaceae bacterium]|nr:N-acetylmuramoyl-L-alanine amidase-like domain-containing protein [Coxiellaceae bacterium]
MPNKTEYLLSSLTKSIDHLSHSFLEKPYITNPQGEGTDAEFDSAPLYRFDGFDCVTFVNNILALSLSHNLSEFQKKLLQINYYHAEAKYENRFHFMSLDWNPQNRKNNIVRDVTCEILDEKKNPIAIFAEGEIDKPNWFLKKSENETDARKKLLKKYSEKFKKEIARIAYLPLTTLFDSAKNPREFIFNQIPHESIIEIVRPNWNLREKIGTNLHVSHLGFAIRKKSGELFFRHASSENKCVVEILLSDYLKNVLDSPTIKGINVQVMLAN